ncbi:OmpA family protein [Frigidibacter sp. RF13]|uniref:OmpA family protein n=1 Tax=Frigidibacter sp. RF13 TaxID=2997340 RepID=UPI00226F6C9E|nr:OmpA family protein [Frigidibacter sp. RF13]MCY1126702.1 OmpA family protein [Frigidibacter sp. RF13]
MRRTLLIAVATALLAAAAQAAPPLLPGLDAGLQTTSRPAEGAAYDLPVGAWEGGRMPKVVLAGTITRTAWRLPEGTGTLQRAESLRQALTDQGYGVIFACATDACGGFDFRYDLALFPEPDMHVDLSDFRYLSAVKGVGPGADYVGLMISRAGATDFVEMVHISGSGTPGAPPPPPPPNPAQTGTAQPTPAQPPPEPSLSVASDLAAALLADGHSVLDGFSFASGSAELQVTAPGELAALAQFLADNPEAKIAIVGHTDASGSLDANIALSRRRAEAVAARLVSEFGADPARIEAQGAGYLAPRASNLTEEGRQKNRRVEVVLTSTR